MTYFDFLARNRIWLGAGALMTFASTFGQTSFISIYAGEIRAEFGLSHGDWGLIYTAATFASSLLLLWVGGVVDRVRARWLGAMAMLGLAATCLGMALTPSVLMLPLIVFLLRFCGQGMLTHISMTAVGRWFSAMRGRAVATVILGISLGEAMIPFVFVTLMETVGWRESWMLATALLCLAAPLLVLLLREERQPGGAADAQLAPGLDGNHWTRGRMVRHWLFWVTLPGFMVQPVFVTALFFQQVHLTELKGWALAAFVQTFPLFTVMNLLTLFGAGLFIDRFGARWLARFAYLPLALSLAVLAWGAGIWSAVLGMALLGMSMGAAGALSGAYWAEIYGTRNLGEIRAVAMAVMVFASALGPGVTGLLIDAGVDFRLQMLVMAAFTAIMSLVFHLALRRFQQETESARVG